MEVCFILANEIHPRISLRRHGRHNYEPTKRASTLAKKLPILVRQPYSSERNNLAFLVRTDCIDTSIGIASLSGTGAGGEGWSSTLG